MNHRLIAQPQPPPFLDRDTLGQFRHVHGRIQLHLGREIGAQRSVHQLFEFPVVLRETLEFVNALQELPVVSRLHPLGRRPQVWLQGDDRLTGPNQFVDTAPEVLSQPDNLVALSETFPFLHRDVRWTAVAEEFGHLFLGRPSGLACFRETLTQNPWVNFLKLKHGSSLPVRCVFQRDCLAASPQRQARAGGPVPARYFQYRHYRGDFLQSKDLLLPDEDKCKRRVIAARRLPKLPHITQGRENMAPGASATLTARPRTTRRRTSSTGSGRSSTACAGLFVMDGVTEVARPVGFEVYGRALGWGYPMGVGYRYLGVGQSALLGRVDESTK